MVQDFNKATFFENYCFRLAISPGLDNFPLTYNRQAVVQAPTVMKAVSLGDYFTPVSGKHSVAAVEVFQPFT